MWGACWIPRMSDYLQRAGEHARRFRVREQAKARRSDRVQPYEILVGMATLVVWSSRHRPRRKVSADFEATIHAGRANPMMFFVMK